VDAQGSASKRAPTRLIKITVTINLGSILFRGSVGGSMGSMGTFFLLPGSMGTFFLLPKQLLSIIKKLAKTELVINYQPGYNYCVMVVEK
jgi:hypothetical protein